MYLYNKAIPSGKINCSRSDVIKKTTNPGDPQATCTFQFKRNLTGFHM